MDHRLLNGGLLKGAVFQDGGVYPKQPINLNGPFPLLNWISPIMGRFASRKSSARQPITLLTFSLLISEDFWVFLSFLSDRSAFVPSDKCAENTPIAGKREKNPEKSSLISKEKPCPSFPWLFGYPWYNLSKDLPCLNSGVFCCSQGRSHANGVVLSKRRTSAF